jgi:hypothetical protein
VAAELDMYFVVDSEEFGSVTQVELKEVRRPDPAPVLRAIAAFRAILRVLRAIVSSASTQSCPPRPYPPRNRL